MGVESGTKYCPYCQEKIAFGAKKCKHCGEWLDEEHVAAENLESTVDDDDDDDDGMSFGGRVVRFLLSAGLGWVMYHFGSWYLLINAKITSAQQYLITGSYEAHDLIWEDDGIALRINDGYYGFVNDARFFDSPIIQWILLAAAIGFFYEGIRVLIVGNSSVD